MFGMHNFQYDWSTQDSLCWFETDSQHGCINDWWTIQYRNEDRFRDVIQTRLEFERTDDEHFDFNDLTRFFKDFDSLHDENSEHSLDWQRNYNFRRRNSEQFNEVRFDSFQFRLTDDDYFQPRVEECYRKCQCDLELAKHFLRDVTRPVKKYQI